jgi:dTDP-4-amino-4,6-dideoxygalactose transaminase
MDNTSDDPSRKEFLPFFRPEYDGSAEAELVAALHSGWLSNGPRTRLFESEFAAYQRARQAVATNSCTAALQLALVGLGVGPGDEVITTPFTFAATCNAIVRAGAVPVLADVEGDTLNLSAAAAEAAVTSRTKAILPVHFAGHPVDLAAFERLCTRYGLALIHDAAHATETLYRGQHLSGFGDVACFSFYATKNVAAGEGGMLTTSDEALAQRVRALVAHGMTKDAWRRHNDDGFQHYDVIEPGFNYKMCELQAALGLAQLRQVERNWQRRAELAGRYDVAFSDCPEIILMGVRPEARTAHHLYVIRLSDEAAVNRDQFLIALQRENIGVAVHYRPIHFLSYYRERFGWSEDDFPAASAAGMRCLSLPLYPAMSDSDQGDVVSAVKKILRR